MKKFVLSMIAMILLVSFVPVYAAASNNKDLKELIVENHEIYFYKDRTNYKILIEDNENSLNITATPDDEKAKVVVTGADDLKENDYTVTVKVTAENGNTKTYTIKSEFKEKIVEEKKEGFFYMLETKLDELNLKVEYFVILIAGVFAIVVINKVISFIRGKKIDRTMDKF